MKKSVLIAGESAGFLTILSAILADKYEVFTASRSEAALKLSGTVDLIIASPKLEDESCFVFAKRIRENSDTPLVLASNIIDPVILSKAHKSNIVDLIKLPLEPLEIEKKIGKILLKYARPYEKPDPVTGLHKKTFGGEQISEMLNNGTKGALMLVEICKYSFASSKIDQKLLTASSDVLKAAKSEKGILCVAADGGFMIFEPNLCEKAKIEKYAENLIKALNGNAETAKLYVSVGLAATDRHGTSFKDLYLMCDLGLGVARLDGRNKACFYKW